MPRPLTDSEKKIKTEQSRRVKKVIVAAGGPALLGRLFNEDTKTITSWGRRGKIPEKHFLTLIGLSGYSPSYIHPYYYNKRHKAFRGFVSTTSS